MWILILILILLILAGIVVYIVEDQLMIESIQQESAGLIVFSLMVLSVFGLYWLFYFK